jgi:hypothetical protein
MKREVVVGGAEACNEMVFECANCAFGGIAMVNVWWCYLVIDVLCLQKIFQEIGSLIVQALELWLETTFGD